MYRRVHHILKEDEKYDENEYSKYTNVKYIEKYHQVDYEVPIDKTKYILTMQWYWKKYYFEELTVSDIMKKIEPNKKIRIKIKKN